MRLPDDRSGAPLALALGLALAGCGVVGGGERPAATAAANPADVANGPAADYPVVLGEPFTIEGVEHVPSDALNHDEVGFATVDREAQAGVTVAHKTLPLPSYVEITALDTGRTILARVERRGPMTNARVVGLSPDAAQQLGAGEGAAVRVRRVNPPEDQRAELRAGRTAPLRTDTPETLLGVLRRKLPAAGSASLADARKAPVPSGVRPAAPAAGVEATRPPARSGAPGAAAAGAPASYALAPLDGAPATRPEEASPPAAAVQGGLVVQAAAFANRANADRAARALGGFVSRAGRFYRVRTGPFATRAQAEAALAKVRAAGYSDAKIFSAG